MYESLCEQHTLSSDAIADLRDTVEKEEFEGLVQGLLKANYGMDWSHWWELVEWNVRSREDDENRMGEEEEREIVLSIMKLWFRRDEVEMLPSVKEQVVAFWEYLLEGKAN